MVRFLGTSPRLPIGSLEGTLRFYEDILGFEAGDPWPEDDPTFVVMRRDDVTLQFSLAQPGEAVGQVTLALNVTDARAVHAALKDRVTVEWGPQVYWYGRREFAFRDPDGYLIIISEATSDPPEADQ